MRLKCKESKILHWHTNTDTQICTIHICVNPRIPPHHQHQGGFCQCAWCAHQVHGGAAWRMWLNKQLRWRLSKVLDLCLRGLQGRGVREQEREHAGGKEREAVTINMHQSDGSMRYLTMQANPNSTMPLSEEVGKATGERGALPIPLVLPLPPQPAESSKC